MRRSKRLLARRVPCRCAEARAGPRYRILRFVETINARKRHNEASDKPHPHGQVDDAILTKKAIDWCYEREWRLVGPRGPQHSPLELEEVVFGMRCSLTVKYAIVKALSDRSRPVRFYEIRERHGRFLLGKYALDTGELLASLPRRALDVFDDFQTVSVVDQPTSNTL
jgi:hypothetical protein